MTGQKLDESSSDLNSPDRLGALHRTGLLGTAPEDCFDRLTRLATRVLHTPVSLVSLVDADRQFFKSCVGLPETWASLRETPLTHSFCQHIVQSGGPLIISDARQSPLVKDNLAIVDLGVVAYAGVPLTTADGHVLGSFCVIDSQPRQWTEDEIDILRDLAASVMTEIGLKQAKEAAEAANKAKDRFLATLSHELRTPVSPALLIATSMAGDETLPKQVREDAATIQRNIELQTRLIDDLLDVTRIENGKLTLHMDAVDLHDVLTDSLSFCQTEALTKGVTVCYTPPDAPPTVRGDPARLRQVFCNLVKNAVKFTPSGGSVTVDTADDADGAVRVVVRDTGIGVASELLTKVFNPFEQGSRAITSEFSGLGLGLAISKGIVEAHGGAISVTSDGEGKGTAFTVQLQKAIGARHERQVTKVANETNKPRLSILLVDDHHDTLKAMSRLLRTLDHRVTTADSKGAALVAAARESFDVVISDLGLPDGTGLELMRELLAERPVKGIALTGYGTESDVAESRAAGFSAHLTKPINFQALQAEINRIVAG